MRCMLDSLLKGAVTTFIMRKNLSLRFILLFMEIALVGFSVFPTEKSSEGRKKFTVLKLKKFIL